METIPPPPPFEPANRPDQRAATARRRPWDDGAVIGGVARDVGARLGTDPLWVRIAFVLLALFSGLGVVLYAGLWCVLRGLRRGGLGTFWGVVGLAICVLGTMTLLASGATEYFGGSWSIVFALSGVAVALWVPRQATQPAAWQPPDAAAARPASTVPPVPGAHLGAPPPRPVSWLGRWTLALALLTMFVGMVIDELNGGRLHPEQWLGVAAIVCGLGIVVSAWRGFAMWLVAPALAFTAAGFVAGHAARVGLDEPTIGTKDYTIWPDGSTDLPVWRPSTDVLGGEIDLWIDGTLAEATTAPDLRVAIGTVEIWSDDTIAVDVVGRVHAGTILGPDGLERDSDGKWHRYRLGPDGPADMVIRAEVSIGDLRLHTLTNLDMTRPRPPQLATPDIPFVTAPVFTTPSAAGGVDIGSGLTMTADGTVIFPNLTGDPYEQVWMSPDGSLGGPVGDWPESNGVTTVYAADGSEYLVLPNQAIVTPDGTVIDVGALREAQAQENLPESETNPAVATSERVDDGAVSATTVAAMTATTTTNEQE